jgi:uncharacterized protein YjbI with pentapeptide repeats
VANPEHRKKLEDGVIIWNHWRKDNHGVVIPDLMDAGLSHADLGGANLTHANLSGATLSHAGLSHANLSEATLIDADLSCATLSHANLSKAKLSRVDLGRAGLVEADLSGAILVDANLSHSNLSGAILSHADLSRANLSEAKLSGADLGGAILSHTNLSRANLSEAKLRSAELEYTDLSEAKLSGADLGGAILVGATLIGVDLGHADLSGTILIRVDLSGASLSSAFLGATVFGAVNLSNVNGLNSCRHSGPSYLDYHTLARVGRFPLPFLRGCGLSDQFIDYLPSFFGKAFEFYSCFISYSTKDQEFADRLYADFQSKGVRCWFAPHDIQPGKKIHDQIDEAIRVYDRLLLILSEASMASEWVKTEISHARQKEVQQHRQVLFPITLVEFSKIRDWKCFDVDTGKDSAKEIREYFIPDFSKWKNHDDYQNAFQRLIAAFKSEK